MAQKKAGGSTKNGRDSSSKRLGIKIFNDNIVNKGSIIIKQNGSKYLLGKNVYFSKNYNIHSKINGFVKFIKKINRIYIYVKCF